MPTSEKRLRVTNVKTASVVQRSVVVAVHANVIPQTTRRKRHCWTNFTDTTPKKVSGTGRYGKLQAAGLQSAKHLFFCADSAL